MKEFHVFVTQCGWAIIKAEDECEAKWIAENELLPDDFNWTNEIDEIHVFED